MMSVIYQKLGEEDIQVFTKGAPEVLVGKTHEKSKARCMYYMDLSGTVKKLTNNERTKLLNRFEEFASEGYRLLAMAWKTVPKKKAELWQFSQDIDEFESDLVFLGVVAMIDPPRPEAKEAIKKCNEAGIDVKMITGDHKNTAVTIAKDIGLITKNDNNQAEHLAISGQEIDTLSEADLTRIVAEKKVFARVSPQHKLKIVSTLKANNEVVAMTGDGVNDAPALKKADIGISMGIAGTDVAREASDMILADDNFATIVSAVEEGRKIYNNIKKFIVYLLACNTSEVLTLFVGILLGFPLPLIAIQILWINLVTDGLPALALGVDPPDQDVMKEKPRDPNEELLKKDDVIFIIFVGVFLSLGTLFGFWMDLGFPALYSPEQLPEETIKHARSLAFTILVLMQMLVALIVRTKRVSLLGPEMFKNKHLMIAIAGSLLLHVIILYVPMFWTVFHVVPLNVYDWLVVISLGIIFFVISEAAKLIRRKNII